MAKPLRSFAVCHAATIRNIKISWTENKSKSALNQDLGDGRHTKETKKNNIIKASLAKEFYGFREEKERDFLATINNKFEFRQAITYVWG